MNAKQSKNGEQRAESNRVFILDTTLRDGEQSPGFHLNATSKLRIARQLEKLGVDVIEAGFPSSSAGEFDACRRIAREIRSVAVTALARADRDEIDAVWRAIRDAQSPQIHVVMPVSDLHIERKLGLSRDEALKKGAEAIAYARSLCENVQYSAEDAGRAELDYVIEAVETMIALGANVINIADSTGYCVPSEFGEIVEQVIDRARGADGVLFSVHCHNDLGLATANAKAGIMAGARRVECTVNGIGERAGNTSLEEIVMLLRVRKARLGFETGVNTTEITRTSRLIAELTGTPVQPNKAVVGANAFAHAAAMQQDGILKDRASYEIMKPEDIGLAESRLVLTARSSRGAFRHRLAKLGLKTTHATDDAAWDRFLEVAGAKKEVTDDDLQQIVVLVETPSSMHARRDDDSDVADTLRHLIFG
ncbi:MAG: 2-isopropylmalate synthase [Chloroflexi bacterium]|nr:MAG: 2-isopropylmalate synthase [Chloroflexota bacterium]TME97980.1 MAG: 2-isopropylmalate synthase [Chloroflexota bacterium]